MIAPVLCWDIDGTLLTTGRAGVFALEKAALEITGGPLDLQGMHTAGLTDVEITRLILRHHKVEASEDNVLRFLRIYEDDLPASLHRKQGQVMPGVRAILEALSGRPAWGSMLLTGNTRRGADAKLQHYGLSNFFSAGAFSDGTTDRKAIAKNAVAYIQARWPATPLSHIVVIGDTPHDIACARAVGVRCLAVGTGGFSASRLQAADAFMPELDAPDFFAGIEQIVDARPGG